MVCRGPVPPTLTERRRGETEGIGVEVRPPEPGTGLDTRTNRRKEVLSRNWSAESA